MKYLDKGTIPKNPFHSDHPFWKTLALKMQSVRNYEPGTGASVKMALLLTRKEPSVVLCQLTVKHPFNFIACIVE